MNRAPRVRQKDLARDLGVSQATVSRALAKNPVHPSATIARVLAEAKRRGYRPDPALGALAAYRRRKPGRAQSLAVFFPQAQIAPETYFGLLLDGIRRRADEFGYAVETIWSGAPDMTLRRLTRILAYRRVEGVIFAPQARPYTHFRVALDQFSSVSIGYTLYSPVLDRVVPNHYLNMAVAYRKLRGLGYRRIGLVESRHSDGRCLGMWRAAFLREQADHPGLAVIPPLLAKEHDGAAFRAWLRRWRPDAILLHLESGSARLDQLAALGVSIPDDLGVALLSIPSGYRHFAGIDELVPELGSFAVDTVMGSMHSQQRGVPETPKTHLLQGRWQPGETAVRQRG